MIRLLWMLARIFCPSFPRHLAAHMAATQTPGPESEGEADEGPGQTPEGEGTPPVSTPRDVEGVESSSPRPPAQPVDPEVLIDWHATRRDLSDTHPADVVDRWSKEYRR